MSRSVRAAGEDGKAAAGSAARLPRASIGPALVAVLIAFGCGLLWLPAGAVAAARTVTYSTERLGSARADYARFRRIVGATLRDPRGWSLNRRVAFREVAGGGEVTIALASPAAIAGFASCSAYYSCRVGGHVLINAQRWRDATPSYRGRALLHAYRQMVINHEVGHALGFGHVACVRPGARAAVMQQQSKGLGGCERNPWPLPGERTAYAARVGVRGPSVPRPVAAGRRASFVELGDRRAEVLVKLGSPRRRAANDDGTKTDSYARPRVAVTYARGRVTAISTRSRADVGGHGLAIGRRLSARMLRDCRDGVASSRCRVTLRRGDGRATTLVLRSGRIAVMRVENGKRPPGSLATGGRSPRPRTAGAASANPLWRARWNPSVPAVCAWWPPTLGGSCE
jgi:hypothetical protein